MLKGWLNNSNIILATDNQVMESALYKGNSSPTKLYDLVVRLKIIEVKYGASPCIMHVSGKFM